MQRGFLNRPKKAIFKSNTDEVEPEPAESIKNYIPVSLEEFLKKLEYGYTTNYDNLIKNHGKEIILKDTYITLFKNDEYIIILAKEINKGYLVRTGLRGMNVVHDNISYTDLNDIINKHRCKNKGSPDDIKVCDFLNDFESYEKKLLLKKGEYEMLNIDNLLIYKYENNSYVILSHSEKKGYK